MKGDRVGFFLCLTGGGEVRSQSLPLLTKNLHKHLRSSAFIRVHLRSKKAKSAEAQQRTLIFQVNPQIA
jgi:hypothetical protein